MVCGALRERPKAFSRARETRPEGVKYACLPSARTTETETAVTGETVSIAGRSDMYGYMAMESLYAGWYALCLRP